MNINGQKIEPPSQLAGGRHYAANASQSNFILLQCLGHLMKEQDSELGSLHIAYAIAPSHNTCVLEQFNLCMTVQQR